MNFDKLICRTSGRASATSTSAVPDPFDKLKVRPAEGQSSRQDLAELLRPNTKIQG